MSNYSNYYTSKSPYDSPIKASKSPSNFDKHFEGKDDMIKSALDTWQHDESLIRIEKRMEEMRRKFATKHSPERELTVQDLEANKQIQSDDVSPSKSTHLGIGTRSPLANPRNRLHTFNDDAMNNSNGGDDWYSYRAMSPLDLVASGGGGGGSGSANDKVVRENLLERSAQEFRSSIVHMDDRSEQSRVSICVYVSLHPFCEKLSVDLVDRRNIKKK